MKDHRPKPIIDPDELGPGGVAGMAARERAKQKIKDYDPRKLPRKEWVEYKSAGKMEAKKGKLRF